MCDSAVTDCGDGTASRRARNGRRSPIATSAENRKTQRGGLRHTCVLTPTIDMLLSPT
jgi:hypothetical protein